MGSITYHNEHQEPVTAEQAKQLGYYIKVFNENGAVRKKEEYAMGRLENLVYYLHPGEQEQEAISRITTDYRLDFFEIRTIEQHGSYSLERTRHYQGDGTDDQFEVAEVFDSQNRLIAEKTATVVNGTPESEVRKYFYEPATNKEYECLYDEQGNLEAVRGTDPPFVPENDHTLHVSKLSLLLPAFAMSPYYITADLLPGS